MPAAEVNEVSLHYEELGAGPACLMLHGGLGLDFTYYRPDFDRLAESKRLVYYDHRCNGRSGRPDLETLTIEQLADDADALAESLGLGQVVAIGHSYGGFVAQELALRHPGRVAGLVLIATTPGQLGAGERPDDYQGPPMPPELQEAFAVRPQTDEEFASHMQVLTPFYLHRLDPDELAARMSGTVFCTAAFDRSMEVLAEWSSVDRLGQIEAPSLVIGGRHDLFTSWPQSVRIAKRIPGAELVVFEESGHFPWLEEPELFWRTVDGWLAHGTT